MNKNVLLVNIYYIKKVTFFTQVQFQILIGLHDKNKFFPTTSIQSSTR